MLGSWLEAAYGEKGTGPREEIEDRKAMEFLKAKQLQKQLKEEKKEKFGRKG